MEDPSSVSTDATVGGNDAHPSPQQESDKMDSHQDVQSSGGKHFYCSKHYCSLLHSITQYRDINHAYCKNLSVLIFY